MYFNTLLALTAATLGLATPTPPAYPNPNDVFIETFTYGGSGCPAGSVANATDATKQVLTLLFDDYVAEIGPGSQPSDTRKNCAINLDVHYPNGWQYSLFSVDYRGFVNLDKGITGQQVATYYFSGEQAQSSLTTTFKGPEVKDYLITDKFLVESIVWSPCGANLPLNINSQIRLLSSDKKASGLFTTDSADLKFAQIFHLQWRQC